MAGVLLISRDDSFIHCVTELMNMKAPDKRSIIVREFADVSVKLSNQKFEYVFSDHQSMPIKSHAFRILEEAKGTQSFLFSQHFGQIQPNFREQKQVRIVTCPFIKDNLEGVFEQILENQNPNQFQWGPGIREVSVRAEETLISQGSIESAIYFVKSGSLRRQFEDGTIVENEIKTGNVIGEICYFEKSPKPWSVVANSDCQLVRISHSLVDKELAGIPVWVKAMLMSMANRTLQYSKSASNKSDNSDFH